MTRFAISALIAACHPQQPPLGASAPPNVAAPKVDADVDQSALITVLTSDVPLENAPHSFHAERTTCEGSCTLHTVITYEQVQSVWTCRNETSSWVSGYALRSVKLSSIVVGEIHGLTRLAIQPVLSRLHFVDCFDGFGTSEVSMNVEIGLDGKVGVVAVDAAPAAACLEHVVRAAQFPVTRDRLPTTFAVKATFEGIDPRTVDRSVDPNCHGG